MKASPKVLAFIVSISSPHRLGKRGVLIHKVYVPVYIRCVPRTYLAFYSCVFSFGFSFVPNVLAFLFV